MSDRRIRDLERRAQQGDVDAEAQLLRQRVRLGELGRGWLELLALIGHPAGCLAFGERPRVFLPDLHSVGEWEAWLREHHKPRYKKSINALASLDGLGELLAEVRRVWGEEALLRARFGLVEACLPAGHPWRDQLLDLADAELPALGEWARGLRSAEGTPEERYRYAAESTFGQWFFSGPALPDLSWVLTGVRESSSPLPGLRLRAGVLRALAPWAARRALDPPDLDLPKLAFRRRVRTLGLTKVQLEVAAFLGHEQAGELARATRSDGESLPLMAWAEALGRWSRTLGARVAVAAARLALPAWEEAMPDEDRPRRCLGAAVAWIARPGKKGADAVKEVLSPGPLPPCEEDAARWAGEACLLAAASCLETSKSVFRSPSSSMAVVRAADACGEDVVRAAVRAELLSWAVGELADDFEEDGRGSPPPASGRPRPGGA